MRYAPAMDETTEDTEQSEVVEFPGTDTAQKYAPTYQEILQVLIENEPQIFQMCFLAAQNQKLLKALGEEGEAG